MKKLLEKLLEKLARWIARQNAAADDARAAETSGGSAAETSAPAATSAPAQTSAQAATSGGGIAAATSATAATSAQAETSLASAGDDVSPSLLNWCWGGFKGASAAAAAGVAISSLRVTASGLSYRWAAGGCERLGAESREDYSHTLACLFCRIGGVWRGGKFDWISTSRTTRDLKNVRDGYGGWRPDAIEAADAYAFVIVSRDGKRRTNIIMEARK